MVFNILTALIDNTIYNISCVQTTAAVQQQNTTYNMIIMKAQNVAIITSHTVDQ